jgi:uncharacterized alkaline shock family protein YloU
MNDKKSKIDVRHIDTKELELPETLFSRDIENKVFQGIILHTLEGIEGISLVGGNFIDNIFGRSGPEGIKGIAANQDSKNSSVNIRIEVNVCYGISIPDKAEEIQTKVAEEITILTGLHVASIHTVFKNVISCEQMKTPLANAGMSSADLAEEFSDKF